MNPDELKLHHLTSALCAITLFSDLPGERILREGEPGGEGGGGGGTPPPKTFTQDEVNKIVQKRVGEVQAKFADYDDLKASSAATAKEVADLKEKLELSGKSEKEREALLAEKMQAKAAAERETLAKERDDAKLAMEQARKDLSDTRVSHQVTAALTAAKALPDMLPYAITAFRSEVTVETDDDDRITSITFDDVPYSDPKKAAEAWLKSRPGFAAAPAGGGGTRAPNGSGGAPNMADMSPEDLAVLGLQQRAGQR